MLVNGETSQRINGIDFSWKDVVCGEIIGQLDETRIPPAFLYSFMGKKEEKIEFGRSRRRNKEAGDNTAILLRRFGICDEGHQSSDSELEGNIIISFLHRVHCFLFSLVFFHSHVSNGKRWETRPPLIR